MATIVLKTNLHCNKCVETISQLLRSKESIKHFKFDMENEDKLIILDAENLNVDGLINEISDKGYKAEAQPVSTSIQNTKIKRAFWGNRKNWNRASFNTLNCLIGCSIGDFGMIIFLQAFYPATPLIWQMVLAIIAGLITSIILETIILKSREKFSLSLAFKTAISMSFISMIGMEFAMNATDFMITGGKAAFSSLTYWLALIPSMMMGFILPLPYNYYKLEKHGIACH